jgi:multiple sugar transport system permease protein
LYLRDPDTYPLAYALQQFVSAYRTQFGPLMAAAVLFTVPVIVLFLLTQKTFIRGIATTGIKG